MDAEGGEILNNFSNENWNNCTRMKIPVDSFIMKEGISGMEGSLEKEEKKIKH